VAREREAGNETSNYNINLQTESLSYLELDIQLSAQALCTATKEFFKHFDTLTTPSSRRLPSAESELRARFAGLLGSRRPERWHRR
jgi:hypothetical protein